MHSHLSSPPQPHSNPSFQHICEHKQVFSDLIFITSPCVRVTVGVRMCMCACMRVFSIPRIVLLWVSQEIEYRTIPLLWVSDERSRQCTEPSIRICKPSAVCMCTFLRVRAPVRVYACVCVCAAIKRPRTRSATARQVSNAHERDLVTNQNV